MFAFCEDMPGISEDVARRVEAELGEGLPEGCVAHVAGPYEGGWRIVDVWQSREAFDAFLTARLRPAVRRALGDQAPPAPFDIREVTGALARA